MVSKPLMGFRQIVDSFISVIYSGEFSQFIPVSAGVNVSSA